MRIELLETYKIYHIEYEKKSYRVHTACVEKNYNGLPVNDLTVFFSGQLVQDANIFQFMKNAIEEYEKKLRA